MYVRVFFTYNFIGRNDGIFCLVGYCLPAELILCIVSIVPTRNYSHFLENIISIYVNKSAYS